MNLALPAPVLAEPYHIEDACKWLNRMTDGEARESTADRKANPPNRSEIAISGYSKGLNGTLAAGNSSLLQVPAWLALVPQPYTLQFQRQFPFRHEPHP